MDRIINGLGICLGICLLISCGNKKSAPTSDKISWETVQDTSNRIHSVTGLSGPESVRYDPDQDVYFVSNFNGNADAADSNGFIAKVSPEGSIDSLKFMTGTKARPMHSPRGMYITGDTLWAADRNGVQAFNRITGKQIDFLDFAKFNPGFLNDIVRGSDGYLYVTDTGTNRVYRIAGDAITIIHENLPYPPNGITIDPDSKKLVLAPWNGGHVFYAWAPPESKVHEFLTASDGGNFDGIEFVSGRLIASSQKDSTLHVLKGNDEHIFVRLPGPPADIGIDTKRMQVAVPCVALNQVDIWQLPKKMN